MHIQHLRKVTAIGGGHGLGRLMATLSFLRQRLIGIVATTDNGGATGILRDAHQCIAWGDIRNCLSQLANQPLAKEVLNYRFNSDSSLHGHNLGNLLLYSLDELSARPLDGIQLLSRLLKVECKVLPMSESPTDLIGASAEAFDCHGELCIDELPHMPKRLMLNPPVHATPEALRHISGSDLIIIGPGSFLTSVMPPLLVTEITRAVAESNAKVIFIDNLMMEQSPAGKLTLDEKLDWMGQHLQADVIDLVISQFGADYRGKLPVVDGIIAEPGMPHRHQSDSLLHALERAVEKLGLV
ncbi:MAG: uridine diphosphate-N-acetylglucosamine-binding protein YvcK [Idiomarina sp.]|nr:uridine diphosphate-N-acetylglucosamine-binding protein YvcK [Idiomarina sp.]